MNEHEGDHDLRRRSKKFALRIIRLCSSLPRSGATDVIGRQLLRSGTSPGAHYREACRARSRAEVVSKIEGGLQELEETSYWLKLLTDSRIVPATRLASLRQEAQELVAIFASSAMTAKKAKR